MFRAWIWILPEGGPLMSTRQVWLVLEVVGFWKTPLEENSWTSQSVGESQGTYIHMYYYKWGSISHGHTLH